MRVVTDSTCDLPDELVAAAGITVVPLTVTFGDQTYRDGVDIDEATFYERLAVSSELPRTSQPPVGAFREVYQRLGGEGAEIVSIHLSSRLSGTLNSASLAREQAGHEIHVELIDSYQVSMALGAIVLDAAAAAQAGGSLDEVARAARSTMERVRLVAVLDTLEYLRRGGRIGRARSLAGSLLNIKPLVQVVDGEVAPFERVRTRARAVERLFEIATADQTLERLFIGSGGADDAAHALMERVRPLLPHTAVHFGRVGPVVGVYAGPGVLGMAMVRKR